MSAFCVFGVSREICRTVAAKKQPVFLVDATGRRNLTPQEWGAAVEQAADRIFSEETKVVRISPEFDSPQFCQDWIAVSPDQVKLTQIMVRIPAVDKQGGVKMRKGVPVMAWTPYSGTENGASHPLLDAAFALEVVND